MWIFSILQKHAYNRSLNHCVPSCSKRCDTTSLLPMGIMVVASFVICASLRYQEWVEVFQTWDETNIGMKFVWNQQALDVSAMSLSVLLAKHRKTWPATGQWLVSSLNSWCSIQRLHLAAEEISRQYQAYTKPYSQQQHPLVHLPVSPQGIYGSEAWNLPPPEDFISAFSNQLRTSLIWHGRRKSTQLLGSFKRRKKAMEQYWHSKWRVLILDVLFLQIDILYIDL